MYKKLFLLISVCGVIGMQAGKGKKPHCRDQREKKEKKTFEYIRAEATGEMKALKHLLEVSKKTDEDNFFVSVTEIHLPEENPRALKRRRFTQSLSKVTSELLAEEQH